MSAQPEAVRELADYAARIRRQNERLAFVVAALLIATAALPVTADEDRVGVLLGGAMVFVLSVVWFRLVPSHAFGDKRTVVFGVLAQPCLLVTLALTGGLASEYFPFAMLLIITTVFTPRVQHTVVVAAATLVSLALVAAITPPPTTAADEAPAFPRPSAATCSTRPRSIAGTRPPPFSWMRRCRSPRVPASPSTRRRTTTAHSRGP